MCLLNYDVQRTAFAPVPYEFNFFFSLTQYPEWHTNFSLKFEMMFHQRLFGGDTSISMENIQIVHHYWNRRKY